MTRPSLYLQGYKLGDYVQLHPSTDRWMMGDRYGTIVKIGYKLITLRMDRSRHTIKVNPDNILR